MSRLAQIFLILSVFITVLISCNEVRFDSEKWKNWEESEAEPSLRWDMTADLVKEYHLKGMSAEQIIDFLGEPGAKTKKEWRYYLGHSGHGIDTGELVLTFSEDTVVDYRIWRG